MGTAQENADKRAKTIETMQTQLDVWTTQIDEVVVKCLEAGAQDHDPYRMRVAEMRVAVDVMRTKLHDFAGLGTPAGAWGPFRTEIRPQWRALKVGCMAL